MVCDACFETLSLFVSLCCCSVMVAIFLVSLVVAVFWTS